MYEPTQLLQTCEALHELMILTAEWERVSESPVDEITIWLLRRQGALRPYYSSDMAKLVVPDNQRRALFDMWTTLQNALEGMRNFVLGDSHELWRHHAHPIRLGPTSGTSYASALFFFAQELNVTIVREWAIQHDVLSRTTDSRPFGDSSLVGDFCESTLSAFGDFDAHFVAQGLVQEARKAGVEFSKTSDEFTRSDAKEITGLGDDRLRHYETELGLRRGRGQSASLSEDDFKKLMELIRDRARSEEARKQAKDWLVKRR